MTYHHLCTKKLVEHISVLILLLLILAIFCLPSRAEEVTGQVRYAADSYRIQTGDVLGVQVYNQSDLSRSNVLVRPDGTASFPGASPLFVAGQTLEETTTQLEAELARLVRRPIITLSLTSMQQPAIYVSGAVVRPGAVQFNPSTSPENEESDSEGGVRRAGISGDFRLSTILSRAGGVLLNADLAHVAVRRRNGATQQVDLWPLLETGQSNGDIVLQAGDSVYIPHLDSMALPDEPYRLLLRSAIGPQRFPVRLLGAVEKPGVYTLKGDSPYLNSAIAQGGGFRNGAQRKKVVVRRFTNEHDFAHVTVDPNTLDFMLRPNDVVLVLESNLSAAGRQAELIDRVLSPFTSAASAVIGYALWSGR